MGTRLTLPCLSPPSNCGNRHISRRGAVHRPPSRHAPRYDRPISGGTFLKRLSIILPAKNEASALARLLPALCTAQPDAEILVVDDGSTDDTRAICAANAVDCLSSPYSMGNGAAIKR